jgi:hypothetical protein
MELSLNTPEKFKFPNFECLQWFAADFYTNKLKKDLYNIKNNNLTIAITINTISMKLLNELKYLHETLRTWINLDNYKKVSNWYFF